MYVFVLCIFIVCILKYLVLEIMIRTQESNLLSFYLTLITDGKRQEKRRLFLWVRIIISYTYKL